MLSGISLVGYDDIKRHPDGAFKNNQIPSGNFRPVQNSGSV